MMWKHKILNGQTAAMKQTRPEQTLHDYQDMVRRIAMGATELSVEMSREEYDSREFLGFSHCATKTLLITFSEGKDLHGAALVVRMTEKVYRMFFLIVPEGGAALYLIAPEVIEFDLSSPEPFQVLSAGRGQGLQDWHRRVMNAVSFVAQIMRCKNIVKVKKEETATVKDSSGVGRRQKYEYYVLELDPEGTRSESDGEGDGTGPKKRLHLCRGHWSEYTAEKPLFGRYVGRFWIPDHKRGDLELGQVIKDYRLDVKGKAVDRVEA